MKFNKIKELQKRFAEFSLYTNLEILTFYTSLIKQNKDYYSLFGCDNSEKNKKLYFADGAIGSGKSTVMKNYIIYNEIENLLYYNPEYYVNCFRLDTDFMSQYNETKKYLWANMLKRISTGESFIVESVFTKDTKINLLKSAKKHGYKLSGIYCGTKCYDLNIERVNKRIQEGSHTIPKEKIIDRYYKSLKNLKTVFEISDTFMVFDNSDDKSLLKIYKEGKHIYFAEVLPVWINDYLLKNINLNEYDCT